MTKAEGSAVERRELDGGFVLVGPEGRASVRELSPGVIRATYSGTAHGAFAAPVQRLLEQRIGAGLRVAVCVDAERMSAYESSYRERWARWLGAHRADIDTIPILVGSGMVRLGINLVNPLVGHILQPIGRRDAFEAVVGQLLTEREGLREGLREVI